MKCMKIRICPFCREKINRDALVCRYCKRDLPELRQAGKNQIGWLPALAATAIIVSGAAILTVQFLKERRLWLDY